MPVTAFECPALPEIQVVPRNVSFALSVLLRAFLFIYEEVTDYAKRITEGL